MNTQLHDMVLRADRPGDERALRRLAALDSARPLRGRALVAELDGRPVAALGLEDRRVVADPFVPTADAVELLRLRASRLEPAPEASAARRRLGVGARRRAIAA